MLVCAIITKSERLASLYKIGMHVSISRPTPIYAAHIALGFMRCGQLHFWIVLAVLIKMLNTQGL